MGSLLARVRVSVVRVLSPARTLAFLSMLVSLLVSPFVRGTNKWLEPKNQESDSHPPPLIVPPSPFLRVFCFHACPYSNPRTLSS